MSTRLFTASINSGKSEEELLPFYAVTGGIPKYIETFCDCKNVEEGIDQYVG
jgi:hypothetical protein